MRGRLVSRALATLAASAVGAVLLSGSGSPVTAHPYPRWQRLPPPPFSPRVHALGVHVGPRVLVLGGLEASGANGANGSALRDGASYDLRTGRWRHLSVPIALTDRDHAVTAGGVLAVQHGSEWWRYDARRGVWSRMRDMPARLSTPAAFRSEVYALSGRRVVVYSTQLRRWTRLPADPLRPVLRPQAVAASRRGTVVTGHAGGGLVADRWDGLRWRRTTASSPPALAVHPAATRLDVGGRAFVVRGDRAWIRLP
jgi:hypothetical protein